DLRLARGSPRDPVRHVFLHRELCCEPYIPREISDPESTVPERTADQVLVAQHCSRLQLQRILRLQIEWSPALGTNFVPRVVIHASDTQFCYVHTRERGTIHSTIGTVMPKRMRWILGVLIVIAAAYYWFFVESHRPSGSYSIGLGEVRRLANSVLGPK